MKRLWFVQQQPFDFMPLKAGLGIITEAELRDYGCRMGDLGKYLSPSFNFPSLCPKIYTTRLGPWWENTRLSRGAGSKQYH